MTLEVAQNLITAALGRMNALYQQTVFDEWMLLALPASQARILSYRGPRGDRFRRDFAADIGPLRREMEGKHLQIGDFEFAHEGTGTRHDVCLRVGEAAFLIGNHTGKSMADIRRDERWLKAQRAFVELSEQFRADPLE